MEWTWLKRDPYWHEDDPEIDPSDLHLKDCKEDEAEFFRVDAFVEGDYVGNGVVGRANQQVLHNEFPNLAGVVYWEEHWPHRTTDILFSIQILKDPQYQELKELIEGLENYPVVDEETLSELECEEEWEAWTDFGARDFRDCVQKLSPTDHDELFDRIYDHEDGSTILMNVWREIANEPVIFETGGAFFPFDHYLGREYCIAHDACRKHKDLGYACVRPQREKKWQEVRRAIIDVLHAYRMEKKTTVKVSIESNDA